MPNIASVFKAEITRIARKELRVAGDDLKKAVATQRSQILELKRRVRALEAMVKRLAKSSEVKQAHSRARSSHDAVDSDATGLRFRARGMAANRKRLGLSAADFGLLVGATGQSVYAWEAGKTKPKSAALAAIAGLRGVGKREVEARLAALKVK